MSVRDYDQSKQIAAYDPTFNAIIMAAMRKGDTCNVFKLKQEWPHIWAELDARYNAPGGMLTNDGYACVHCGKVSNNPNDVIHQYCNNCHKYADDEHLGG
jgi:hypothetical protein